MKKIFKSKMALFIAVAGLMLSCKNNGSNSTNDQMNEGGSTGTVDSTGTGTGTGTGSDTGTGTGGTGTGTGTSTDTTGVNSGTGAGSSGTGTGTGGTGTGLVEQELVQERAELELVEPELVELELKVNNINLVLYFFLIINSWFEKPVVKYCRFFIYKDIVFTVLLKLYKHCF
jgi:hypothetical protein